MEIKKLQEKSVEAVKQRLSINQIPLDDELLTIHLMEEAGELAHQIMNKKLKRREIDLQNLGEEISDCMILLMNLANIHNIDLEKAILDKIKDIKNKKA